MATVTGIKKDIQFNTDLTALLNTMKSIAASQFQSLERTLEAFQTFHTTVQESFRLIDLARVRHPFAAPPQAPPAVIAVTSDTGLLGGLNAQVMKTTLQLLEGKAGTLIVVGERGQRTAREHGYEPVCYPGVQEHARRAQAEALRDECVKRALEGRIGSLTAVYPRALSFTHQEVETLPMIPCSAWAAPYAPSATPLLESAPEDLVEYLVFIWMGQRLYEIFGSSRLAELAARAVHLESSLQELQRRGRKLRLDYFRSRRELIDRNMRELFTARVTQGAKHA